MRTAKTALGIIVVLGLVGCAPTHHAPPPTTPPATAVKSRTPVEWTKYPPDSRRLIDEAQASKDCAGLQDMFDVADNAGFLDEMKYIDEALELAGCY